MMTSMGEEANGCEEWICNSHFVEDVGRNHPGINAAREIEKERVNERLTFKLGRLLE